jgi:hypothetical protein
MLGDAWIADITEPRTIPVMAQYVLVREALEGVELTHGRPDNLIWWWSLTGVYSASVAYNTMFLGQSQVLGTKELWKTKAPRKCRFFGWHVLHDRSWASNRLWRHGLRDESTYSLCDQEPETLVHLLVGCPFAKEVWFLLLHWGS